MSVQSACCRGPSKCEEVLLLNDNIHLILLVKPLVGADCGRTPKAIVQPFWKNFVPES